MPIYAISNGTLSPIKTTAFLEKQIQTITENNLEIIFGFQFICSEFSTGTFRVDTVAFDPETSSFVLIEYKKDQSFSIIDQGYAYLSTMLNHKADFVLLYNERTDKSLGKNDFDWSQSRVIFISPSFTEYQREAARFKDLPLDLCQVHLYSNNTIGYTMIRQEQSNASVKTFSQASTTIAKVSSEVDVYTEERLLEGNDEDVRQAYWAIKDIIQQINPDVEFRVKKSMVCFYTDGRGLVWVRPESRKITLFLRKGLYDDRYEKIIPEGWGKYPELRLSAQDIDLLYVRNLLQQANLK
ncbi:MAG: hypothetical protein HZB37_09185 [Planctomycetes bacterium]|nr:hypothetical protein [Planctomycetota bacterium]